MTSSTGKEKSSGDGTSTSPGEPGRPGRKPNRNTVSPRPFNHKPMTRAEMYEMLRKAVENTK